MHALYYGWPYVLTAERRVAARPRRSLEREQDELARTPRRIKKLKNDLVYLLVKGVVWGVCRLSRRSALRAGERLGTLTCLVLPKERRKVREGLDTAFGDVHGPMTLRRLIRQVYVDLGRNAVDAMRLRVTSKEELHRLVRAEGLEHVDSALSRGRGLVFLTGHLGCWELDGAYVASLGYPLNVIAKPVYDARLDRLLVETRERAGVRNIARGKATRDILRALRRGEAVGFLIDQDTKVDGVFVDFFGRPAYTPSGAAVIALKTGAPIVPITIHREADDTHHVIADPEIPLVETGDSREDIRINTQRCLNALERRIRDHPSQWVWMHERWKTKPAKEGPSDG